MPAVQDTIDQVKAIDVDQYKWGFSTDVEMEIIPKGLNEEVIRHISAKKNEPAWMLEWRLDAFRRWQTMTEPKWARVEYPPIDFQDIHYYAAPKGQNGPKSLDEIDPAILETYKKLGIPLSEVAVLEGVEGAELPRTRVAVDAVFDSVSVVTTFREELKKAGVIFCSISEALQEHPDLVRQYLGSVVPVTDNYYATLNCAVFTDGSFVYIPRACAARWNSRPISASTSEHRPVRAHADHRRQGLLCQLSRRLHGAQARREPAPRRRGRTRHAR